MGISQTVCSYMERCEVDYDVLGHAHTACSRETAEVAHVSGKRLAKGVLLKDDRDFLLAVIPANHHLDAMSLADATGRDLVLAPEDLLPYLFRDCEWGAVPPLGGAFGVQCLVSPELFQYPEVYFEAGDHEHLVRVGNADFRHLMGMAQCAHISDVD